MFYQLVMTAMQSNQLPFISGIKLLMEQDLDEAVNTLELEIKRQEEAKSAEQAQLMQQEQMAMMAQAQQAQQANEVKAQIADKKSQADIMKILAQARFDMKQQAMTFDQDLVMKKIDAAIQMQKEKQKANKPKK